MKKRVLSFLLTLCLIVVLFPAAALAADDEPGGEPFPVCACETRCTEGGNPDCLICAETPDLCTYTEEPAPADEGEPAPTAEQGTQESPWNISADGEENKVIAYLTQNSDNSTYTLIISGQGKMEDFTVTDESDTRPWVDFVSSITAVYVNDGVTKIGACAFYSCVALANVVFFGEHCTGNR